MSQENFLEFLTTVGNDPDRLARYDGYSLSQLLFHARNEGYAFTVFDVEAVIGRLEASVILDKDKEPFDGSSSLWRSMWGHRHLAYVVEHLIPRHTEGELAGLVSDGSGA